MRHFAHPARLLGPVLALAGASAALGLASAPAAAQDGGGDKVNTLIIYGDDECPKSEGNEIVVCARMDEGERYRIPERLRQSNDPANEAWSSRVQSYETVGDFGPLSCTPIGSGGELGCTAKMIEAAYAERAQSSNVRFSQLIAEERAERLSTIDAEAAATQARVEELERQYDERMRREQESDGADATDPSPPPVGTVDPSRTSPATPSADVPLDNGPQPIDPEAPGVGGL